MRHRTLAFILVLTANPALASPLSDALKASGGILCFARSYDKAWLKSHPGQTLREAKFSIATSEDQSWPVLRMSMTGAGPTLYLYGGCGWMEGDLNRGVQDNILISSFAPISGVGCHMMTDVTGASAEEGGDFPVDWQKGGQAIEVHHDEQVAGWRSFDTRRHARFVTLNPADRIIRLNRAPPSTCRELTTKFAPG